MFLGKLWVRLRGELLTLRDDLTGEGELRGRSREFLEKVERSLNAPDFRADAEGDVVERIDALTRRLDHLEKKLGVGTKAYESPVGADTHADEALDKALEEHKRTRENENDQSPGSKAPPPKPRSLG